MRKYTLAVPVLLLLLLICSCQSSRYAFDEGFGIPPSSKEQPLVHFIMDASGNYHHFRQTLDYTKIPESRNSVSRFNDEPELKAGLRVVCLGETWDLSDRAVDSLKAFVGRGGMLYLTERNWDERFAFLMGLRPEFDMSIAKEASGIALRTNLLPGMKGLRVNRKNTHQGLDAWNFKKEIIVHASAYTHPDYPLLVEHRVGKGRVLLYNSMNPFGKSGRGIFFAGLLAGLEGIPYPQLNVASIFLDDFPAPLYEIKKEPVWSEMKLDMADFVDQVWWPDMEQLAAEMGLKYTAYLCFDYNERVTPPFMFLEWDAQKGSGGPYSRSTQLGRKVLAAGHELGLHGYNHQSLLNEVWPGTMEMEAGLQAALKKWKISGFGDPPVSYVPPSNDIDSLGLASLSRVFPGLRFMQSTYLGHFDYGGNREFGPEPWNNSFFDFPRISSGFLFEPSTQFNIASLYLYTGIWTHFVHPDDVFQIEKDETAGNYRLRNHEGLGWHHTGSGEGMLDRFKNELEELQLRHPMMRFRTATEASNEAANWRYAYYEHLAFEDYYTVGTDYYKSSTDHQQFWAVFIRPDREEQMERSMRDQDATFMKVPFLNGHLYSLTTPEHFITLPDLALDRTGYTDLRIAEQAFEQAREKLLPLYSQVDLLANRGNLADATELLEEAFMAGLREKHYWLSYVTYMSWQDRLPEAWRTLENVYQKDQDIAYGNIAVAMAAEVDYPNDEVRRSWMQRLINWELASVEVLQAYVNDYSVPEDKYYIKAVHERLLALEQTPEREKAYLTHLLQFDLEGANPIIQAINPCENTYRDLAYPIAWALAGKEYYDRALAWADCSKAIDTETIDYWMLQSKSMNALKSRDEFRYFKILIGNDPERAATELRSVPTCTPLMQPLADEIAKLLAAYGYYSKASEWLPCTRAIAMIEQMEWLYETGRYEQLELTYKEYTQRNPEDQPVHEAMVRYYLYMDRKDNAAMVLSKLRAGPGQRSLQQLWNAAVKTTGLEEQRKLYLEYPGLLQPEIRREIEADLRLLEGHALAFRGSSVNDRLDPTVLMITAGYDLDAKGASYHEIRAVRSFAYPINFIPESAENATRDLLGLSYTYVSATRPGRETRFNGRIENSGEGETYFHLGLSSAWQAEREFYSGSIRYAPVQTGPGYIAGIYQARIEGYGERQLSEYWKATLGVEGNYYTDNMFTTTANLSSYYAIVKQTEWHAGPFVEVSYALASENRRDGFPYWMADNRFYGGGGMALTIADQDSPFYMTLSAAHFYENQEEPAFERYQADLGWRIRKYTKISLGGEVYTIPRFFSNAFYLGLSYQL